MNNADNSQKRYEFILASLVLMLHVLSVLLYIFDKQYVGFILTNPVLFFVLGCIVWKTSKMYIPYGSRSYMSVSGKPAQRIGHILILISFVSGVILNLLNNYNPSHLVFALYMQLLASALTQIIISARYGTLTFLWRL